MDLFQMKNNVLSFSPQAMALEPFKVIWKKDKTKNKETALAELSYIWFMEEINSPFFNIINEAERSEEIIKVLLPLGPKWKESKAITDARTFWRNRNWTISEDMLRNTMAMLVKTNNFLATIDPAETYEDRSGKILFKHDLKKTVDTAKAIPELLKSLRATKELVLKDRDDDGGMRGSQEKGILEDGA